MRVSIFAAVVLMMALVSCSATFPTYTTKITGNTIDVPVSGFDNSTINIVSDETSPRNILLIKRSPMAYDAYHLSCTNDKKVLDVTPNLIVCPVCGSTYNFDGTVKRGPATSPLLKFATELSPDQTIVTINIEALGL